LQTKAPYQNRINRAGDWLRQNGLAGALIADAEAKRNPSLTYLSGMPMDALLFVFPRQGGGGESLLLPWDTILADQVAWADRVVAYGEYGRDMTTAVTRVIEERGGLVGESFDLPSSLTVYQYEKLKEAVPTVDFLCREAGFDRGVEKFRERKDLTEQAILREACRLTDILVEEIAAGVQEGRLTSEIDVALLLERRSRELGGQGVSFETLAAGPDRSWGIHCHPAYTDGPFAGRGLSLVDFGLRYQGYATDVTLSVASGSLSKEQEEMVALVEEAYKVGVAALKPGVIASEPAAAVNRFFRENGWTMPHSLGHGVGLEVHEAPWLKDGEIGHTPLEEGMFFTVEPGLYHPQWGGFRWENDFLITATGVETMTHSRIVRIKK
jgi:Xaa-Pro dipeptidase